jgi:uncharacterized protein (DUF1697 family)
MKTYISILRGINVSGKNMIKMAELKKCFENAGFKNINTYIQSGNIVFRDKEQDEKDMIHKIEGLINNHFSLSVPVIVRNTVEWSEVVAHNPFQGNDEIDIAKLHVTFLSDEPGPDRIELIKDLKFDPDLFVISGRTVYLYCPDGYGNTKINNTYFENKLKVTATTRNWRTVNELMRLAEMMK